MLKSKRVKSQHVHSACVAPANHPFQLLLLHILLHVAKSRQRQVRGDTGTKASQVTVALMGSPPNHCFQFWTCIVCCRSRKRGPVGSDCLLRPNNLGRVHQRISALLCRWSRDQAGVWNKFCCTSKCRLCMQLARMGRTSGARTHCVSSNLFPPTLTSFPPIRSLTFFPAFVLLHIAPQCRTP